MRTPAIIALVVTVGILILACDQVTSPNPPGIRAAVETNYWRPVDIFVPAHCTGDDVIHITGKVHRVIRVTEDGAGGFHVGQTRTFAANKGVGIPSGARYVRAGRPNGSYSFNAKPPFHETYTHTMRQLWIGQGKADDVVFVEKEHFTINANGEVTVFFEISDLTCKNG
ncbi:MAG: hypothetical protein JRF61_23995 [Deltaproteobacteria bacterium]|jgi:hypothetical protein|nr:hypothetical protein [Deltaproteobacteria bacterium]